MLKHSGTEVCAHSVCPGCRAKIAIPSGLAGKPVRCTRCRHVFRSDPADARAGDGSAPAPTAPPGASADRRVAAPAPAAVGRFLLVRRLGRGGMGVVYEAEDPGTGRRVAIKVLSEDALEGDETAVNRFILEAEAASRIRHPDVVRVLEAGRSDGRLYLVMELMSGGSAATMAGPGKPLPPLTATRIAHAAARGLVAVHAAGYVHRDVKPGNILMGLDGMARLADFGMVKMLGRTALALTETGNVVGTPSYMSPEQCTSSDVDGRSDLYSLGATYFRLLTGHPPFEDPSAPAVMLAHCTRPPPDPRTVNPLVPGVCLPVLSRSLEKFRTRRYQTASEMVEDLAGVEAELVRSGESVRALTACLGNLPPPARSGVRVDTVMMSEDSVDAIVCGAETGPADADPASAGGGATVGSGSSAAAEPPLRGPLIGGLEPTRRVCDGTRAHAVEVTLRFPTIELAKAALDRLDPDVRRVSRKVIRPATLRDGPAALLQVSLQLPLDGLTASVGALLGSGGQFLSLGADGVEVWNALAEQAKRPPSPARPVPVPVPVPVLERSERPLARPKAAVPVAAAAASRNGPPDR